MASKLNIIEQIVRNKVYNSSYWKEKCFALTSETIIDNALELEYIGGIISTTNQPSDFICLLVKLIQLNPSEEIIDEYLSIPEYKYLRALTVLYIRMTYPSSKVYIKLEPLYNDYRKLRIMNNNGKIELTHMDGYIDDLLLKDSVINVTMPKLVKRKVLEESGELKQRVSILERDLNLVSENDDEDKEDEESDVFDDLKLPDNFFKEGKKRKREEENEENGFIEEKENNNDDNKGNKKRKIENNVVINAESKVLDENSDEYWLELRRKIGLK